MFLRASSDTIDNKLLGIFFDELFLHIVSSLKKGIFASISFIVSIASNRGLHLAKNHNIPQNSHIDPIPYIFILLSEGNLFNV